VATKPLFKELEDIVAEIFQLHGFGVAASVESGGLEADLIITSQQGRRAVVEVKAYSSRTMGMSVLVRAASQLARAKHVFRTDHAMLAVSAILTDLEKAAIRSAHPGLLLYDVNVLTFLAVPDEALSRRLAQFLRQSQPFSAPTAASLTPVDPKADFDQPGSEQIPSAPPASRAKELGDALRKVDPGAASFKAYENAAANALRYALSDHFAVWHTQHGSENRMSIYDLVGRISSDHDFWITIVTEFHSRYVIFEFKNYTDKISQGQIYTTEKYLYRTALRATAIIVSPQGPDENAISAAKGALREHGKLIINLTNAQLLEMLELKDSGDDPTDVIVRLVDDMLMRLER
jgi:hypothetical protein